MNPYKILGVSEDATDSEITNVYYKKMQQYSADNYRDHPLSDVALNKRKEIIDAYDTIIKMRESVRINNSEDPDYFIHRQDSAFPQVRQLISKGNVEEALRLLKSEPNENRSAEWNFLMGKAYLAKGWAGQAKPFFEKAHRNAPSDREYQEAFDSIDKGFIEKQHREQESRQNHPSNSICYDNDLRYCCYCCDGYIPSGEDFDCCCSLCKSFF